MHGGVELTAAVTAARTEDIAGEALAVHPHEHAFLGTDLAGDERQVLDSAGFERDAEEVAVGGGDQRFAHSTDRRRGHRASSV